MCITSKSKIDILARVSNPFEKALIVHRDHVSAVLDVAYSPTGKEFVSASYDRSVRIFSVKPGWESKVRFFNSLRYTFHSQLGYPQRDFFKDISIYVTSWYPDEV
jgi:WD40 repeat protein